MDCPSRPTRQVPMHSSFVHCELRTVSFSSSGPLRGLFPFPCLLAVYGIRPADRFPLEPLCPSLYRAHSSLSINNRDHVSLQLRCPLFCFPEDTDFVEITLGANVCGVSSCPSLPVSRWENEALGRVADIFVVLRILYLRRHA